jgi:phenylacetate-CoA ligase
MNLFKKILELKGFPIREAETRLRSIKHLSPSAFQAYVDEAKWSIFNYHRLNNNKYSNIIQSSHYNQDCWETIPILTKLDLQGPIKERITGKLESNQIYINNTSGSSGHPFFFAKDKMCHALGWALIFDRYERHGIIYGKSLQARFYGIPLSKRKLVIEKIKDKFSSRVRFSVFDLSDVVLERYFTKFKKFKFEYINGYTSSLVLFARYLIDKGVILKDFCPSLQVAFPTAEMCSSEDKLIMERAFGVSVADEYGAAEIEVIAFEDEGHDRIISNENIFIEIVDENGLVVPDGTEGKILITSLNNHAMPFIRYEIGDLGILATNRKGRHQILKKLIGRTNDFAILPSGKKSPGLTFYYISKSLLEGGGFMKEFIIKQTSMESFHFEYVADREISDSEKNKVYEAMDLYLEPGLKASFERKEQIIRTGAGKLKHFQNIQNQ